MSRAAAEKREEREASFKEGLSASGRTDRRAQDATQLRKQKHASVLSRRRGVQLLDSEQQWVRMFALYQRDQLIKGDERQRRLLYDLLERSDTELLNEHVPALLGADAIPFLVSRCGDEQCAVILQQLSGIQTKYDLRIASAMVQAGFLNAMCDERNARSTTLWEVLINIILSCREARNEVLTHRFFAPNSVFESVAPLVSLPHVMSTVCALIEADKSNPPPALIQFAWPMVMAVLLHRVQPMPWCDQDEVQRILLSCTTGIVCFVLTGMEAIKRPDISIKLLLQNGQGLQVIRTLCELLRTVKDSRTEVRIIETFVRILALPVATHDFHLMMREAGCIRDMIVAITRVDTEARFWGFLWVGNYMADGTPFVRDMLVADMMPLLCQAMDRDHADVKAKAIYAVMTMFAACEYDREHSQDGALIGLADQTLHTLVFGHRIFARLAEHLGLTGLEQLSIDILKCLASGLRWNRNRVIQSLRDYHVLDTIEDLVATLKGDLHTELYELAVEVDDLLHGRAPENRDAALEAAAAAALGMDMDGGASNPYLLTGRFEF